jgi:farnesyl-diphosphate farnesyltransferase
LQDRIVNSSPAPVDFEELASFQASTAERELLERATEALELLAQFGEADQHLIREVLALIISGQELDLSRFSEASINAVVSLSTDLELDDYTYRVAGCVGEFWTRICRLHVFRDEAMDDEFFLTNGVRFGKGLQLVNILRDLPADLRQGRCYLPSDRLWSAGMTPPDLLDPANYRKLQPLYESYLEQAELHLAAGWQYTASLPHAAFRVRLACAWPILIGLQTLQRLRAGNVLAPELRIKVSRSDVRRIIARTIIRYPWRERWERLFLDVQTST